MVIKMEELFNKINIQIKDMTLYERAFSHTSYSNEHKKKSSYERLEFLGDAVVDLVVADYLYSKKDFTEGEMTKTRASYVCENALFEYANDLGLSTYIKIGHGEQKENGNHKKTIVADVFEALIGAIYLDLGYSTARRVVLNLIVPYIEDENIVFFSDYKTTLQEFVQTTQKSVSYVLVNEEGPAHEKSFTVEVVINDIVMGSGVATSKKEAEQEAAKMAISKLAIK